MFTIEMLRIFAQVSDCEVHYEFYRNLELKLLYHSIDILLIA